MACDRVLTYMRVVAEPFDFRAREKSTCRSGQLWKLFDRLFVWLAGEAYAFFAFWDLFIPNWSSSHPNMEVDFVFFVCFISLRLSHTVSQRTFHTSSSSHSWEINACTIGWCRELDRKIFHSMTLKTRLKPGVISYSRNETKLKTTKIRRNKFLTVFNSIFLELTNLICLICFFQWKFEAFVNLLFC